VKEMAGNIIPAIATTNAVIAGLIVLQALQVLRSKVASSSDVMDDGTVTNSGWSIASSTKREGLRTVCLQVGKPHIPLGTFFMFPPNPTCGICRDTYVPVLCDPARVTLGEILGAVRQAEGGGEEDEPRELIAYEGTRMLCDPDWDDNLDRSLDSLSCTRGKFLTLHDEDGAYENVVLCLSVLPDDAPAQGPAFVLPTPFPRPKARPQAKPVQTAALAVPPSSSSVTGSRKRSVAADGDTEEDIEMPAAKRAKTNDGSAVAVVPKEDGDGYIVIEDDEDDDDIMEIS